MLGRRQVNLVARLYRMVRRRNELFPRLPRGIQRSSCASTPAGTLTTTRKARIAGLVAGLMAAHADPVSSAVAMPSAGTHLLLRQAAQELREAAAGTDGDVFCDR